MVNPAEAGEEPGSFCVGLETARFQAEGWQEPCESGDSRTVLRRTGGETPPVYPTRRLGYFCDYTIISKFSEGRYSEKASTNRYYKFC